MERNLYACTPPHIHTHTQKIPIKKRRAILVEGEPHGRKASVVFM